MTRLIQQAAACGVSLLARARAAVDEHAIRQLSAGWDRPSREVEAAWLALHPWYAVQLHRLRGSEVPPMDDWVDADDEEEEEAWDDDGELPY